MLQFFRDQGQLPNFASALGLTQDAAGRTAEQNPLLAITWALQGYLGDAIRSGQAKGLSGPDLATYAQQYGQVSETPERAGKWYSQLFGATPAEAAEADTTQGGDGVDTTSDGVDTSGDRPPSEFEPTGSTTPGAPATAANPLIGVYQKQLSDIDTQAGTLGAQIAGLQQKQQANPAAWGIDPSNARQLQSATTQLAALQNHRRTVETNLGKELAKAGLPVSAKTVIRRGNDGKYYAIDPTTGQATPIGGMPGSDAAAKGGKIVKGGDGKEYMVDPTTGQATPIEGIPGSSQTPGKPRIVKGADGRYYTVDPSTNTATPIEGTPAGTGAGGKPAIRTPSAQDPYIVQINPDGTTSYIQNPNYGQSAAMQKILQGPALLALNNHMDLINEVQQKIAAGEMTPSEGDQYIASSKAYTDAVMQGTTPWQQQQEQQRRVEADRNVGLDALNARLTHGASLAQSFASNALTAGARAFAPPGGFHVDPAAFAQNVVNTFTPPNQVNWATSMVNAANPAGVPALGTGGNTPWTAAAYGGAAQTPGTAPPVMAPPPVGAALAGAANPADQMAAIQQAAAQNNAPLPGGPPSGSPGLVADPANRDQWATAA